ncbi:MAG TPA: hypothetical protein VHD36_16415 [Pirellulales bacterium]|nr:hypothetical protein [Pirellulales bacterium]
MAIELEEKRALRSALRPILIEARDEDARENPVGIRYPFFRPVLITLDETKRLSAFSRDLSPHGIGLMHSEALPLEEVEIRIGTGRGYYVKVRTMITSCRPCGDACYVSRGHFMSIPAVGDN